MSRKTPLGIAAQELVNKGMLVPDEVVCPIVKSFLQASPAGYILDGFPRTVFQAESISGSVEIAVLVKVPDSVIEERLSSRLNCQNNACGAAFNAKTKPPKNIGACDLCGSALAPREDDRPEAIRKRLEQYWHQTRPVIEHYEKLGLLRVVDGNMDERVVADRIGQLL
jgi:adenylate kinase